MLFLLPGSARAIGHHLIGAAAGAD
ncbi:hypothetical protein CBM2589_B230162 [Cupriavidus taiwanensis]|uniref:Uncharacterized protein n=1 Tax=Cupriavidus taiwanensis TaxID=164546 RepID=A0A975X0X2_9BURK|nr:hypothetical protein CBM2589_B230162 [Cupriavidus taiwanensis]